MKIMLVGLLNGFMEEAGRIAIKNGSKIIYFKDSVEAILNIKEGKRSDVIFCDIKSDIISLLQSLKNEKIEIPVITCGIENSVLEREIA
jgi:two-component system, response regulator FlrC